MPGIDSKQTEIARLKSKLIEVESILKEQKRTNARLLEHLEKRKKLNNQIEDEIITNLENHKWKKQELTLKKTMLEQEVYDKMKNGIAREGELNQLLSSYDVSKEINTKLHENFAALLKECNELKEANHLEKEELNKTFLKRRIAIEEIVRKTMKSMTADFEIKAVSFSSLCLSIDSSHNIYYYLFFRKKKFALKLN